MTEHDHDWKETDRDDNAERIRTRDECTGCGARRYGCYAKWLGELCEGQTDYDRMADGTRLGAWGPVGRWTHSIEPSGELPLAKADRQA
jgi:hypothetical protein